MSLGESVTFWRRAALALGLLLVLSVAYVLVWTPMMVDRARARAAFEYIDDGITSGMLPPFDIVHAQAKSAKERAAHPPAPTAAPEQPAATKPSK